MRIYVVQPGDSVDAIAASQNVPAQSIIYDNQLVYPYALAVGQALLLSDTSGADGYPAYAGGTPILLSAAGYWNRRFLSSPIYLFFLMALHPRARWFPRCWTTPL